MYRVIVCGLLTGCRGGATVCSAAVAAARPATARCIDLVNLCVLHFYSFYYYIYLFIFWGGEHAIRAGQGKVHEGYWIKEY